jgi:hypothetical protein
MWSRTSSDYATAYALDRSADFAALRDAVRRLPQWQPVYTAPATSLFVFDDRPAAPAGPISPGDQVAAPALRSR